MCAAQARDAALTNQFITVKLRLRDKHSRELNSLARAVNLVWNYCNEISEKAWTRDRKWLSGYDLGKLTAGSSKELGLLAHSVARTCQQYASSRNKAKRAKIKWRGRRCLGWIPFNTDCVRYDGLHFAFSNIRLEPMHNRNFITPDLKLGAGSFNQDSRGRWYINLSVMLPNEITRQRAPVGIDLGLKDLATLSDGVKVKCPLFYRKSETALASAQRAGKTKRVRQISRKISLRRKDYLHKKSKEIATSFGLIFVGDITPSKIAKTRMAKSSLDAGWGIFKSMLSYKAIRHGGRMIEVDERWTTQTCSACGSLPEGRPRGIAGLGIREWTCNVCGSVHDRDVNAAKNILRIGLDTLAEGAAIMAEQSKG